MLPITISEQDFFDERTQTFSTIKETKLQLEHSLVSLSKWEGIWHKSLLANLDILTPEEFLSYIECMTITQNVNPNVFKALTVQNLKDIQEYINDPHTATTINNRNPEQNNKKEIVTAEIIYYWMFSQSIPKECEKWHLNRLITLIRVFSIKNAPPKKMSKAETMARHKAANAKARARNRH